MIVHSLKRNNRVDGKNAVNDISLPFFSTIVISRLQSTIDSKLLNKISNMNLNSFRKLSVSFFSKEHEKEKFHGQYPR